MSPSETITPKRLLDHMGLRYLEKTNRFSLCCPFHDDRNPSAGFYQDSEKFFCYTCSLSLDMVGFYAKYMGINRSRAEVELEQVFGAIPKKESVDRKADADRIRNKAAKILSGIKGLKACVAKEEELEEILWQYEQGKIARVRMLTLFIKWTEVPANVVLGEVLRTLATTLE